MAKSIKVKSEQRDGREGNKVQILQLFYEIQTELFF